jgi:hypothetical protein
MRTFLKILITIAVVAAVVIIGLMVPAQWDILYFFGCVLIGSLLAEILRS